MKTPKKGLATGLLAMAMVTCPVSAWGVVLPVYASETPVSAGVTATENYSEEGKQDCEISVTIGSDFTITIPKKIILSGMDGTSNYEVTAKGNISADERIKIVPDKNFLLKSAGKADATTTISQSKTSFDFSDVSITDGEGTLIGTAVQGTITAEELSAGNWTGTFNFTISMTQGLEAGAYDANGEMVASWEELTVTYGLDVEKDYSNSSSDENYYETNPSSAYYVLTNNDALKDVTTIVIGNDVSSIGEYAFYLCLGLEKIVIPSSVESIKKNAFWHCEGLTRVCLSEGVETLGDGAFGDCYNLTECHIPNSVTSFGNYSFNMCSNLTSVTIPDGVTSIGMCAFWNCSSLTSIDIPDSVTSIGRCAFLDMANLASITIGSGVTSIGQDALLNCKNLESVVFKNPNGWYAGTPSNPKETAISSSTLSDPASASAYLKLGSKWLTRE